MGGFSFLFFWILPTANMDYVSGEGKKVKENKSVKWRQIWEKPQNTKKWQIDGNNNREDDMKGREMEYMSAKEFSKNLGQWIRKHNRTKYSWAEKMGRSEIERCYHFSRYTINEN